MSIVEIINEKGIVQRIDYWNDNKIQVIKSHTVSYIYVKREMQHNDEMKFIRGITKEYNLFPLEYIKCESKFNEIKQYLQHHQSIDEFTASDRARGRFQQWFHAHYNDFSCPEYDRHKRLRG